MMIHGITAFKSARRQAEGTHKCYVYKKLITKKLISYKKHDLSKSSNAIYGVYTKY